MTGKSLAVPTLMEAAVASKPPRRWSKRRLALVVSSLIVAVLVLVVGLVGVARSVGFVMNVVDATGDVGQITPERASDARQSVTPASDASPEPRPSLPPSTSAVPAPSGVAQSGPPNAATEPEPEPTPLTGAVGTAGTNAGGAATDGSAGSAGASSPSPTFWESFVQSTLALVGQNAISMCGRNTCNVGQVCCNASCGTCVAQGATCDQTQCTGGPRTPTVVLCGTGQCNDGQVCCNPSCGTCVGPGETCSEEPCR